MLKPCNLQMDWQNRKSQTNYYLLGTADGFSEAHGFVVHKIDSDLRLPYVYTKAKIKPQLVLFELFFSYSSSRQISLKFSYIILIEWKTLFFCYWIFFFLVAVGNIIFPLLTTLTCSFKDIGIFIDTVIQNCYFGSRGNLQKCRLFFTYKCEKIKQEIRI